METTTTKKQSNRAIQRTHATYKKKSEISEALHLIKPYVNESTYKFLSHFIHTNGTGVTQMKISEWCKKVGVSTGAYSKTVKREIENTFSQSLIITTPAPMKYDAKRKKKVKASEFKSLLPLSVLKSVIRLKELREAQEEQERFLQQIEIINEPENGSSDIESDIEGDIESDIESIQANPWESKGEDAFSPQQNNSFRENHVENNIKINNNKSIIEPDFVSSFSSSSVSKAKNYKLKKEVRALLDEAQALLENDKSMELTKEEYEICGNKIQIMTSVYGLTIADIHETAIDTCYDCIEHTSHDFGGYFYRSLENRFLDGLLRKYGIDVDDLLASMTYGEYDELDELRQQIKTAYFEGTTAIMELVEEVTAEMEMAATIEAKPKNRADQAKPKTRKPTRKELLPEWFGSHQVQTQQQEQEMSIDELIAIQKELELAFSQTATAIADISATEAHTSF